MDRYKAAMSHGQFAHKKNVSPENQDKTDRLRLALEKQIDSYVDAMKLEEDPHGKHLLSPKLRREKLKHELKEAAELVELSQLLESAVRLLLSQGASYLSEDAYKLLISDFSEAYLQISNINLDHPVDVSSVVKMNQETLKSIAAIATEKYSNAQYFDCLSLFSLLSVLNPGNAEYWFRLAISAQKNGNLDLATRCYAATAELDPKHIGARLFAAECCIQRKLKDEAKAEFIAAKEIARNHEVEKMWLDLLEDYLRGQAYDK